MATTEHLEGIPSAARSRSTCGTANSSREARAARAVEEYLAELEAGRRPDRNDILARHPDIAELLQKCFDSLAFVQSAGAQLEPIGEGVGVGAEPGPAARVLGDFRIIREIGRGGMGIVYEAEQLSLSRRVALKVLPFAAVMDPKQLQRFKNEAMAAAHLDHPNIVHVYFVGSERGVHFYAMQFVEGHTLAELIAELRRKDNGARESAIEDRVKPEFTSSEIPETRTPTGAIASLSTELSLHPMEFFLTVAKLGIQAAEAIDHAHQVGIIHRDVKPSNLLLDLRGNLWVTDFGLARIVSPSPLEGQGRDLTMTGDLIGTLRYMSPEQALAKHVVDHRTDIYSLGVTLYELLTLRPVFCAQDRHEILHQIAFDEPKPPRKTNPLIPVELETIVLKACAKNPSLRYATTQELADDLRRYLDDKPILARRPTLWQKAQRWARRHRRAVAAAAVLGATVLMLGSVGWAWLAQERTARQARMTRAALEAFQEAASLGGQAQDTPEDPSGYVAALSAAKRAHALLPDDEHDTELGRRIGELCTRLAQAEDAARTRLAEQERNWKMLRNLEQVRSLAAGVFDGQLSDADIDAEYARVFRAFGQDLESSTVETAQWIQSTKIRAELAAAVDDWAMVRQRTYKKGDETWRTLLSIALAADPDDIRVQIRDWLLRGGASDKTPRVEMVDVALLPPATVLLLAGAVVGTGDLNRAVELLREAQRAHPGDFWLNYRLAVLLHDVKPARWSEMVRFGTAALSLRPTSAAAHILLGDALRHFGNLEESIAQFRLAIELQPNHEMAHASLGNALIDRGDLEGAIAAYRRALDLKPDNAVAHSNLAIALEKLGDLDAAIDEYRRALLLRPDFLDARKYLGDALLKRGDFEGAIAECRRALELATDDAEIHNNLGLAFQAIGNLHGAIGEFRRASELKPDIAIVHTNLGLTLWAAGDKDGAIAKFRRALELKPDDATTHYSLGCYLSARGDLDDAIAEYRMALELKPDYAEANCNLGLALQAKGQFNEALALLRRGHDIGTRTKGWQYQSEQWVHQCERLVALDARLDAISSGEVKPKDAVETIEFALFCLLTKNRNVAATRFFIEAFAVEPNLERDMTAEHRYNAACAAALAASGEGEDTTSLDASDHVRLRHLALNWLKSDLAFWHEQVDDYSRQPAADSATKLRAPVLKTLQHWQADADLAGVRNAEALAKLSELEQESWRKLWADVDALIQKLQP